MPPIDSLQRTPLISSPTAAQPLCSNFGGDKHGITFGSDKRFRLVDRNAGGDNHVITFGSTKRFELVDTNAGGGNCDNLR